MATYSYQLNADGGASVGYVKYNVSPAFTNLGSGDRFTISGQAYWNEKQTKCIIVNLSLAQPPWLSAYWEVGYINKTIAKGSTGTFSITCTIPQSLIEAGTPDSDGLFDAYVSFILQDVVYDHTGPYYGRFTESNSSQKYRLIQQRIAPDVDSISFADRALTYTQDQTLYQYYGSYIQAESLPRITATFSTDSRDARITTTHTLVVKDANNNIVAQSSGTSPALATTNTLDIPAIMNAGQYTYIWTVLDSTGLSTDYQGTFQVLGYSRPSITNWVVERYRTVVGEPDPVPAPDGDHVMLSLTGNVSQVASKNAWTLALRWSENGGAQTTITIGSGNDGDSLLITRDDTLFTAQVSLSSIYEFTAILTDKVGQTAQTYEVPKATCYLNIEKNGIGIGMYTVGTASDKRVDIADDYTLHANGAARFAAEEITTYTFTKTSGNANVTKIQARRFGCLVSMIITASLTAATSAGSNVLVGKISGGPLPGIGMTSVASYSGSSVPVLNIVGDGTITVRAIGASYGSNGATAYWTFMFLTND